MLFDAEKPGQYTAGLEIFGVRVGRWSDLSASDLNQGSVLRVETNIRRLGIHTIVLCGGIEPRPCG